MNENLVERFGRSRQGVRSNGNQAEVWIQPQQLNPKVRQYFEDSKKHVDDGTWLDRPEIPTSEEILDTEAVNGGGDTSSSDIVVITPNKPTGAWQSKDEYLGAHYELLREDASRPLREAVSKVKATPTATEDAFSSTIGIYEKVHICGITCSTRGMAIRVTFSLQRIGKKILWEQSKRLITGSLVVLTPADDMFQTTAIVATVAARPLDMLNQNPPEIDLFIARTEELEIDPMKEFVMVEERGGYYEADRHTLLALQKMMREPFPLQEHLVKAESAIPAPTYIQEHPVADLTAVLRNNKHETYDKVNMLKAWPAQPSSDLDASQLAALRRILTKQLAIVQGPPGTGKTHVSVEAIKIMLANRQPDDPPIIIACQTNHAVDQILRHIAKFEPQFVRLGGQSKDQDIRKRTLYEVRKETSEPPLAGSLKQNANKKMKMLEKEFKLLLTPLEPNKQPLDYRLLEKAGLLTKKQADSLELGASQWIQETLTNPKEARSPFLVWLGKALVPVSKQQAEELGFEYEEADLAFEQLKELEAENLAKDDDDFETLYGMSLPLADNFTCRKVTGVTEAQVKDALKQQDLWKVREAVRGEVYRHLQSEMKRIVLAGFREKAKDFNEQAAHRRTGAWEHDEPILKKQRIIGMTTTGLSKYRGLLAALQPKIVLIEEAGETLEAPVTVACMPSLQHLILVGDHKQLRPHCHVKDHEDRPYYLNVSLFERLVNNKVEFAALAKQRRMIPEIRRLLYPIYKDLIKDHASVLDPENRPNVPGMGGVNSFFFTHQWPEQRDEHMSAYNPQEVDMVVGLMEYLVCNGMDTKEITVLTFYNGQRKALLTALRNTATLAGRYFNVVTVDSYQGEENKVVILSLVRSNDKGQIGFLGVDNRVCVALSRAQCGMYIFGNGLLLYGHKTWQKVIEIVAGRSRKQDAPKIEPVSRLGEILPLRCSNHNEEVSIRKPEDWDKIMGGCEQKCKDRLPCGHSCPINCHPFSHDEIICRQRCGKSLQCSHGNCDNHCGEVCSCKKCAEEKARSQPQIANEPFDGKETLQPLSNSSSWSSFACEEPGRYAVAASAPSSRRESPQKQSGANNLVELDTTAELVESVNRLSFSVTGARRLPFGVDGSASTPPSSTSESESEGTVVMGTSTKWTEKVVTVPEEAEDWSKKASLLD